MYTIPIVWGGGVIICTEGEQKLENGSIKEELRCPEKQGDEGEEVEVGEVCMGNGEGGEVVEEAYDGSTGFRITWAPGGGGLLLRGFAVAEEPGGELRNGGGNEDLE